MATGTIMRPREIKSKPLQTTTDSGGYFIAGKIANNIEVISIVLDCTTDLVVCGVLRQPSSGNIYGRAMVSNSNMQIVAYAQKAITGTVYYLEG